MESKGAVGHVQIDSIAHDDVSVEHYRKDGSSAAPTAGDLRQVKLPGHAIVVLKF